MFARRAKLILELRRNGRPRLERAVGHDRILLSDRHGRTEKSRGPGAMSVRAGPRTWRESPESGAPARQLTEVVVQAGLPGGQDDVGEEIVVHGAALRADLVDP